MGHGGPQRRERLHGHACGQHRAGRCQVEGRAELQPQQMGRQALHRRALGANYQLPGQTWRTSAPGWKVGRRRHARVRQHWVGHHARVRRHSRGRAHAQVHRRHRGRQGVRRHGWVGQKAGLCRCHQGWAQVPRRHEVGWHAARQRRRGSHWHRHATRRQRQRRAMWRQLRRWRGLCCRCRRHCCCCRLLIRCGLCCRLLYIRLLGRCLLRLLCLRLRIGVGRGCACCIGLRLQRNGARRLLAMLSCLLLSCLPAIACCSGLSRCSWRLLRLQPLCPGQLGGCRRRLVRRRRLLRRGCTPGRQICQGCSTSRLGSCL